MFKSSKLGLEKAIIMSGAGALHQFKTEADCDAMVVVDEPQLRVQLEQLPAGAMELLRFYARADQFFYVLSGEATVELEGGQEYLSKGQGLLMKPGTAYRIFNGGNTTLRYVITSQPRQDAVHR